MEPSSSLFTVDGVACIFEEAVKSESQLVECFISTLFDWSRSWGLTSSTTVLDFISSLSSISEDSPTVLIPLCLM